MVITGGCRPLKVGSNPARGIFNKNSKYNFLKNIYIILLNKLRMVTNTSLSPEHKREIELMRATRKHTPTTIIASFIEFRNSNLIRRSNCFRLIDLGSAGQVTNNLNYQKVLENVGIKEYIGVDISVENNDDFRFRKDLYDQNDILQSKRIKLKSIKGEILETLRKFPENYANVHMTGIDTETFNVKFEWGYAVLLELKRVVPKNGFIITDNCFIGEILKKISPEFKEFNKSFQLLLGNNHLEKENAANTLQVFLCKENDMYKDIISLFQSENSTRISWNLIPGTIAKYVVNMPNIGFRVYLDNLLELPDLLILINIDQKNI